MKSLNLMDCRSTRVFRPENPIHCRPSLAALHWWVVSRCWSWEEKIPEKRRNIMKSSTQDKLEGKWHKIKGKIKQVTGKAVGNRDLEVKGKAENRAGKVQEKIGQIKDVTGK